MVEGHILKIVDHFVVGSKTIIEMRKLEVILAVKSSMVIEEKIENINMNKTLLSNVKLLFCLNWFFSNLFKL